MKAVKLILVFLIFAGVLTAALSWDSIVGPLRKSGSDDETKENIEQETKDIVNKWDKQDEWSQELHMSLSSHIDQLRKSGNISRDGEISLRNSLIENSANKAKASYLSAIRGETRSKEKVNNSYKAIVFLREKEGLSSDERIKEIEERHQLFTNVCNFIASKHNISPNFRPEEVEWIAFSSQQDRILNQAANFKSNKYYNDLKDWPGFEEGLNVTTLKKITDAQRNSFYNNLCGQIIDRFDSTPPNVEDASRLKSAFSRFASEGGETTRLAKYRRDYEKVLQEKTN